MLSGYRSADFEIVNFSGSATVSILVRRAIYCYYHHLNITAWLLRALAAATVAIQLTVSLRQRVQFSLQLSESVAHTAAVYLYCVELWRCVCRQSMTHSCLVLSTKLFGCGISALQTARSFMSSSPHLLYIQFLSWFIIFWLCVLKSIDLLDIHRIWNNVEFLRKVKYFMFRWPDMFILHNFASSKSASLSCVCILVLFGVLLWFYRSVKANQAVSG